MNLKNRALALLLLFSVNFTGCATFTLKSHNVKAKVDKNIFPEMWGKTLAITELDEKILMPQITFEEKDPFKDWPEDCSQYKDRTKRDCEKDAKELNPANYYTLGKAYLNVKPSEAQIKIFTGSIEKNLQQIKMEKNSWLTEAIATIHSLGTIAHEMLHHAMYFKGLRDKNPTYINSLNHHELMKEKKYMEQMLDYLGKKHGVKLEKIQTLGICDLEYPIKLDYFYKRKKEREESSSSTESPQKIQLKMVH